MRLEILFLSVFIISKCTAERLYSHEPLVSEKTKFFMYGNIGSFDDILSKSLNISENEFEENEESYVVDTKDDVIDTMLFQKELKSLSSVDSGPQSLPDMRDYSAITAGINTRRIWHHYQYAGSKTFYLSWLNQHSNAAPWDLDDGKDSEATKLAMLNACSLQLLLHARFKILQAMQKKNPIRNDKRYMLGYLFNRMRRVIYDSRKVVFIAVMTNKYKMKRKMRALLRLYQQVARYDVDLADLARYIRKVFLTPADFDRYEEKTANDTAHIINHEKLATMSTYPVGFTPTTLKP